MSALLSWLSLDDSARSSIKIDITSGLHRGTSIDLEDRTYTVGSSPECDIVLRDEGVAAEHAVLRIKSGAVFIETQSHEVGLGAGKVLNHREGARLRLPSTLFIGSAEIKVSREGAEEPGVRQMASRMVIPVAAAIIIPVLIAIGISSAPDISSATSASRDPVDEKQFELVRRADNVPQPANAATKGEVIPALAKHIEAAGLNGITLSGTGKDIMASGSITQEQHAKWIEVVTWFDRTYSGTSTLVSTVQPSRRPSRPPVSVQAVWYGENPYMIASDGKRYYQGAELNSGWSVRAIQQGRVILAKGSEEFQLTY